jgi:2-C-methyl-D-erythritol 4-phosphate cytidylyltransferase
MSCAAIIVASGSSRRMGFDKLAAELKGRSVLRVSVEQFMASPSVGEVIVVCPEERFANLLSGDFPKPICRVDGGAERQDSVAAGLALVGDAPLVAVHDGARPLITVEAIEACIAAASEFEAASLARPISETIKRVDSEGFSCGGVERENLWHTETPQIFKTTVLRAAYAKVREEGLVVTDEVSALEALGIPTKLVLSRTPNFKITHAADLALAAAIAR